MTIVANLITRARWNTFVAWHVRNERSLPFRTRNQIQKLQQRRIRSMVGHAYRNVPFYREAMQARGLLPQDFKSADDLSRLPQIEGQMLREHPQAFRARNIPADQCLTLESTGTSGRSKRISYDRRALFLSLANRYRINLVFSKFLGRSMGYSQLSLVRAGSASAHLRRFYESHSWMPASIDLKRQRIAPGELDFEATVGALNAMRPDMVRGCGSYIGWLYREAHHRNAHIHRPAVISYGIDKMASADRDIIEQEMGIPVVSSYQAVESLQIGFECEQRKGFHMAPDWIAYRVIGENGETVGPGGTGHLIISNLVNRATVLLNYKLGDVVTCSDRECPCGRTFPLIRGIRGRSHDALVLADGRIVHPGVVLERLQAQPGVIQVQIVQSSPEEFLIRVVGRPALDTEQASSGLIGALQSIVGRSAGVHVEWMREIPQRPGEKVKAVISHLSDHS